MQQAPDEGRTAARPFGQCVRLLQIGLKHGSYSALQERTELAQRRPPGLPPIRDVTEVPESDRWSTVDVELPFEEVNDMLGVQLERRIVRGVPPPW